MQLCPYGCFETYSSPAFAVLNTAIFGLYFVRLFRI